MQLYFDRPDRHYHFGEHILGKVVIVARTQVTLEKVWIAYNWRTHGAGNQDFGELEEIPLIHEKTSIKKGERREFPFSLKPPNGPVSYHGRYLNVDWYLAALASGPGGLALKAEEDFLLSAAESTGKVLLGDQQIEPKDLPPRTALGISSALDATEVKAAGSQHLKYWSAAKTILLMLAATLVFVLLTISHDSRNNSYLGLILSIAIGAVALKYYLPKSLNYLSRAVVQHADLSVLPEMVYAGSRIKCRLWVGTRQDVFLSRMKVSLCLQERVTRPLGTRVGIVRRMVQEQSFEKVLDQELATGTLVSLECEVPIEANAPPSFSARFNSLEWLVRVQLDIKGRPDVVETVPITVLP